MATSPEGPALAGEPRRQITDDEVATFWRDGVVALRGVLAAEWVLALADPVERTLRSGDAVDMGSLSEQGGPSSPAFAAGVDHWRHDDVLRAFALTSPLGPIVATLLRSSQLWLWEDSVLVKEPGSPFATRFHTDAGYFHLTGDQIATTWVPLDPAGPSSGMVQWVRGSHRDGADYRPNLFVTDDPIPGTEGEVVPDVLGSPELAERLITFELEPGDITVHHARTLHGAPPNSSGVRRRAVSVRYCGADARYLRRAGLPGRPGLDQVHDGQAVGPPWCPQAWPR